MTRRDWRSAKELIGILEKAGQEVPEELLRMAERFDNWKARNPDGRRGGRGGRGLGRGGGGGGRGRRGGGFIDFSGFE